MDDLDEVEPAPVSYVEPPAGTPLTNDELATMQAGSGYAADPVPSGQANPVQDAEMKGWIRANIRWILAELDFIKEGHSAEARETLNP